MSAQTVIAPSRDIEEEEEKDHWQQSISKTYRALVAQNEFTGFELLIRFRLRNSFFI